MGRTYHGGDLLRSEGLGLTLEVHLDEGLATGALDDSEGPVLCEEVGGWVG